MNIFIGVIFVITKITCQLIFNSNFFKSCSVLHDSFSSPIFLTSYFIFHVSLYSTVLYLSFQVVILSLSMMLGAAECCNVHCYTSHLISSQHISSHHMKSYVITNHHITLYYVQLCCVMLCCAVLCCVVTLRSQWRSRSLFSTAHSHRPIYIHSCVFVCVCVCVVSSLFILSLPLYNFTTSLLAPPPPSPPFPILFAPPLLYHTLFSTTLPSPKLPYPVM